jgi:hypothetical protein
MENVAGSPSRTFSRRSLIVTGAASGGALAAASVLRPSAAAAASPNVDAVRTPARIDRLFDAFFAAKSLPSPDRTMAFFDPTNTTYIDGTFGIDLSSWEELKTFFEKYMPHWTAGARSYPTKILGDEHGATVFFTNTPQEFGHEIRGISVVDIRGGKFARWIDYWDGRHFGVAATKRTRVPASQFPTGFGESKVGESLSGKLSQTVATLTTSLAKGDARAASAVFAEDGSSRTSRCTPKSSAPSRSPAIWDAPSALCHMDVGPVFATSWGAPRVAATNGRIPRVPYLEERTPFSWTTVARSFASRRSGTGRSSPVRGSRPKWPTRSRADETPPSQHAASWSRLTIGGRPPASRRF